ncbi:glycosyltransferase [Spirosoma sp.]|uniref:glycosyltransferase n=1 Tax=Spirosoma sp. TaxID=1899569 RepID=UPI003B3B9E79
MPSIDYSIVICTYNPDERLLKRCLQAVDNLDKEGLTIEVIIVDNNSAVPVSSLPSVKAYAQKLPALTIINEREQGVNHARIAAIDKARGKYTVYFDYDNEPEEDYLQALEKLHEQYPDVAAWGPGHVWVDFLDGIDKAIEKYARNLFQERHEEKITFAKEPEWQPCYPYGTGLCTATFLLKEYVALARQGRFTLSGRKGNLLTSGEDTQMVLICIHEGYAAGVSPTLKLKHIIPGNRANHTYVVRLIYGTGICYETCVVQVFPEYVEQLQKKKISEAKFIRRSLKKYIKAQWSRDPDDEFSLVSYIASISGVYLALNKPIPSLINRITNSLKVG